MSTMSRRSGCDRAAGENGMSEGGSLAGIASNEKRNVQVDYI